MSAGKAETSLLNQVEGLLRPGPLKDFFDQFIKQGGKQRRSRKNQPREPAGPGENQQNQADSCNELSVGRIGEKGHGPGHHGGSKLQDGALQEGIKGNLRILENQK
jgi:hypothetical protein